MNLQKKIHTAAILLLLFLSLLCFLAPSLEARVFYTLLILLFTASALFLWIKAFQKKKPAVFLEAAGLSVFCTVLWMEPVLKTQLIVMVFSLYMLFICLCLLVQTVLDFTDHVQGRWGHLLLCLLYLTLSVLSFVFRRKDLKILMVYFGLYLLLQSLQMVLETYFFSRPGLSRDFRLKRWISLPVYLVSFLPGLYLRFLLKKDRPSQSLQYDERKNDQSVDLRVFIHTGLGGEHLVGHMTFAFNGTMYSYGNYDTAEEKFFRTIGPGIFFTVPANLYVNNSCIYEQSVLFEYGLHLTEQQLQKLQQILSEIEQETFPWRCPLEEAGDVATNFPAYENDYASRLWYRTGAEFFKFSGGPWKTYWVLGDNCSLFAEDVLSRIGCDIVHKTGIVSPGEYFEFFEAAFADPASCVVYRSWHDAARKETLFPNAASIVR